MNGTINATHFISPRDTGLPSWTAGFSPNTIRNWSVECVSICPTLMLPHSRLLSRESALIRVVIVDNALIINKLTKV